MALDENKMNSILLCIKHKLGVDEIDYYDMDIITDINMAFMVLNQIGIGPKEAFSIAGSDEKWTDFLGDAKNLESVKTLIYLKVKMIFDPPSTGTLIDAMERQISELQWRLYVTKDNESGGNT